MDSVASSSDCEFSSALRALGVVVFVGEDVDVGDIYLVLQDAGDLLPVEDVLGFLEGLGGDDLEGWVIYADSQAFYVAQVAFSS